MTPKDFLMAKKLVVPGEPEYDQYQRYVIPHPDKPDGPGRPWTRATTVAKVLSDTANLDMWKQRQVVLGAANDPNVIDGVTSKSDKDDLNARVAMAHAAAGSSDAADRGTALHEKTADYDNGLPIEDDDEGLQMYRKALASAGLRAVPGLIERTVVVPGIDLGGANVAGVAGTFDRIYQTPKGKLIMGDLKTSGSDASWGMPEWEIQLGIYSKAKVMWDWHTRTFTPMPEINMNQGVLVQVNLKERYWAVYKVDLVTGRESLELALKLRAWRKSAKQIKLTTVSRQSF